MAYRRLEGDVKSLGNVLTQTHDRGLALTPRDVVLFAAPVENELRWSESGIEGAIRFLRRVYTLVWRWHERLGDPAQKQTVPTDDAFSPFARALRRKTHQTIARITRDFEQLHLNTSVALLMELFNALTDFNAEPARASAADTFVVREAIEALVVMLTPFCPHIAEEMWEGLGHSAFLDGQIKWPVADADLARQEELEIPLQVNGKLRSRILTTPEVTDDELRVAALADEKVRGFIDGRQVVKVIVVPQRLVNVVIK